MKKYLMIMGIISLFLIAACAQQPAANDVQNEADDPSGAVMEVPVPGNEVEETVGSRGRGELGEQIVADRSQPWILLDELGLLRLAQCKA